MAEFRKPRADKYENLNDIVSRIGNDGEHIKRIMALTYEFNERQLLNFISRRDLRAEAQNSPLSEIERIRPLVVYDAANTQEYSHLQHLLELHPWNSRAYGCHHSKAYCLITYSKIHLVIGSFNITKFGLFRNREVFDYFEWDIEGKPGQEGHILRQWVDFLDQGYLQRTKASGRTALKGVIAALEKCRPDEDEAENSALVFSGYEMKDKDDKAVNVKGLDQLEALWRRWFKEEPTGLFVVSPFFDTKKPYIASAFKERFKELSEISICTSEDAKIWKGNFGDVAHPKLFHIPKKTGQEERAAILAKAKRDDISISENQTFQRNLHAKILLLFNAENNNGLSYVGSANFSRKAWLGPNPNQELGVARRVDDITDLRGKIMKGLHIAIKSVKPPDSLPPVDPNKPEDDESKPMPNRFPEFIDYIVLELCPDKKRAHFLFYKRTDKKEFDLKADKYEVKWGSEPAPLRFKLEGEDDPTHFTSRWFESGEWPSRLEGGRNLAFYYRGNGKDEGPIWFPFQYSEDLIKNSEYLSNRTSSAWLRNHASKRRKNNGDNWDKGNKGDKKGDKGDNSLEEDRKANTVIAMQGYLRDFGGVEDNFRKIVADLKKARGRQGRGPNYWESIAESDVFSKLDEFFRIIRMEYAKDPDTREAYAFRLGELLLLVRELSRELSINPSICEEIEKELGKIEDQLPPAPAQEGEASTLRAYLGFVREKQ